MSQLAPDSLAKLLPPRPQLAPRRAFRGKRRYFEKVASDARAFTLDVGPESWWDLWHYHADWPGWGNLRWTYRRQHLDALCQVFQTIAASKESLSTDFQLWIQVDGADAGHDAVFLHTPNGNGTEFPIKFDEPGWGVPELEAYLHDRLPDFSFRTGYVKRNDDESGAPYAVYFAYCPSIGVSPG